ncbi:hypothetical protein [Cardiobacterium valvarum]|uniref:hypothetical protein n=1 Tax=Cardiobacterium valvarum TaxID=194702 RepID=UPI001558C873|nr:hypothetical protein [Cardiobacterium valvarum]
MQFRSDAFATIHETAVNLFAHGIISKKMMWDFDAACLRPLVPLSAAEIRAERRQHDS